MAWTMIGTDGTFEYWTDSSFDGMDSSHRDVYRRRISSWNVNGPDGEPMGARWECKLSHFSRYYTVLRDAVA